MKRRQRLKQIRRCKKIKKQGYITVGLSADYPPFEFHKTINGEDKIVGFDVSLAKKVAKQLGVKLRINEMQFSSLLGALKTGKIDMIISGMNSTPARAKEVSFSKNYLSVQERMLIRTTDKNKFKTTQDFSGHKVGAQTESTELEFVQNQLTGSTPVSLAKFTDLVLQLNNKKIDGIVTQTPIGKAYANQSKTLTMINPGFTSGTKQTNVAVSKDAPALLAHVNKTITYVDKHNLMDKYQKTANKLMFSKQNFLQQYGNYYVTGVEITVALALIGVIFGTLLGTLLAMMRRSKIWLVKAIGAVYVEYTRGTPLLVQVFIVFFGTQILGLHVSAFVSSSLAMGMNSGAYVSEIIRGGINSVDTGQDKAARSLGLASGQSMRYVILPQAFKNILPALGNEFISVIKESSIVSVVGVGEIMFQTGVIQGASFKPFFPLIIASLLYFVLTFGLSRLLRLVEKKFNLSSDSNIVRECEQPRSEAGE